LTFPRAPTCKRSTTPSIRRKKKIIQRYDFKGSKASIAFDRPKATLTLIADDDFKMKALFDVLQSKMIKRGVPVKKHGARRDHAGRERHGAA